jgi:NAD(P)-dependent dehydrogenase (short-subunit alcohol dehydrogenase family)
VSRSVIALEPLPAGGVRGLGPLALVADGRGVAQRLAARLDRAGMDVLVVASPTELDGTRGVIFLGGLDRPARVEDARDALGSAFLAAKRADLDNAWMTVTALGGDFGLAGGPERAEAMLAGLAGLTKTIALEHPNGWIRALDLVDAADPEHLAAQIAHELGRGGPVEVGLGVDGRNALVSDPSVVAGQGSLPLGPDDVVLVSGGARGVTAACILELAAASRSRFVLLGRSHLDAEEPAHLRDATDEAALKRALFTADPSLGPAELGRRAAAILAAREARATCDALRALGCEVRYEAVDVSQSATLAATLDAVREAWGPFSALVHGAGVLADKRLRDKTLSQFDSVVDTKLGGLLALLDATQHDPLRVIALFSSVAARAGNIGQADYALANEALNRIAASEARRRPGCTVRSIGWGPWAGGMVTAALARQFTAQGVPLLEVRAGARAFVRELSNEGPTECVIGGELAPLRERVRGWRPSARVLPQLRDHALGGNVVVPAVLAMDRMLALARAFRADARGLVDVRVLKGVAIADFEDEGELLEIGAETADGVVTVALRSSAGRVCYRARVRQDAYAAAMTEDPGPLSPWPTRDLYVRELFHGPAFQSLSEVRVGPGGMRGRLATGASRGWSPPPDAVIDVPALDGAVQLAALWTRHRMGAAALPTGLLELRVHAPVTTPVAEAVLVPVREASGRTVTDVRVLGTDGAVLVELLGLEMHVLPSGEYPGNLTR